MMTRISYSHDGSHPTYGATYRMWFRLPVPNRNLNLTLNLNPNLNPNPKTDLTITLTLTVKVTIIYAVQNDTQIKFKIVL